jgi:hypothetical protein
MKIKRDRIKVAERVLRLVEKKIKDYDAPNIYLGTYQNGREQGYSLHILVADPSKWEWVAWSEDRSSDSVVVYIEQFDSCQSVSDDAYATRQLFDSENDAAKYIAQLIKEHED